MSFVCNKQIKLIMKNIEKMYSLGNEVNKLVTS
jgi:hypothetical protein